MKENSMTPHPKPERYTVLLTYSFNGIIEDVFVSYNTKLDNVNNMQSSYSQAVHTASRYNGEIFAGYANGDMIHVKTYRK